MGFDIEKPDKKQELYSDSALNPGYESRSLSKATSIFNKDASLGNSVVPSREEEVGLDQDAIAEKELMQHNENE